MATSTLGSGTLVLAGTTSGTTTVTATAVAGTTTLTLPAATDTLVGKATTDTLTNKTLTGAVMNGTLGATTPSTAAVTTLEASTSIRAGTTGASLFMRPVSATPSDGTEIINTFFTGSQGPLLFKDGTTTRMTLNASGDLGIGTTTPNLGGLTRALTLNTPTAGNYSGVELAGAGTLSARFITNNAGTFFGSQLSIPLVFETNAAERARISSDGTFRVKGAGTAGSTDAFQVAGTAPADAARIDSSGNLLVGATSISGNAVEIYNNSNQAGRININKTTSGLFNAIANSYSGTYVGGVNYDNTTTSFPTSSDVRLKKDIVDAGSASAKIDQIRIVSHGWKHDDAVVEFGIVAQELVNVAPQAVSVGDDGEEIETTWGVDYSKLVPLLIKAHQEQQALITTLTARITALEGA